MDKAYDHKKFEQDIYQKWESSGGFSPSEAKETFCIIMPPPNSNGELHLGHATFIAVSDLLIRYNRMRGKATLWLPGIDHAGILTQSTFEKKLQKEGKNRYDLGREEFVRQCYQFCMDNKFLMENQMKALGSSCDWSREKFTLDPGVSRLVMETFVKMHREGLVYRGYRIVNWSTKGRSTLSDLETEEKQQIDPLYYLNYGPMVVATTRPETIFADVAVAVNPKDKRYQNYIGKTVEVPLANKNVQVIADESVDMEFGTGVLKVTPGHDMADFEIGQRHNLEIETVIDFDGRMTGKAPESLLGLKVAEARLKVVELLEQAGKVVKTEQMEHTVKVSERYGEIIEPLVSRQWFVKIKPLADKAMEAVRDGKVKIVPEKYQTMYFNWLAGVKDWPISRQLWWGHQLPVWYRKEDQKSPEQKLEFDKLLEGDTRAKTEVLDSPIVSVSKPDSEEVVQDPDTFDTWFSSGQWPVNTLKTSEDADLERFYPTSVMNTAYEILFVWVARMIMFGLYLTDKVPFEIALINGVLRDESGAKMSKSKGNGVNPNEAIDKYGADAVRMALIMGRETGNDLLISKQQMEEKIRGSRNFANKIWNATRYIEMMKQEEVEMNKELEVHMSQTVVETSRLIEDKRLGLAAEYLYNDFWHYFCDKIIEESKSQKISQRQLSQCLEKYLKLLHPFMPFVTEAVYQETGKGKSGWLMNEKWPED